MLLSRSVASWCIACVLAGAAGFAAHAQPSAPGAATGDGRTWSTLSPARQNALRPLQQEWNGIEATSKTKWIEIADRLPSMPPAERDRIQARMTEWTKLTPRERGRARLNYKEAQQVPVDDRKARWEAYKALPPDRQRQLAERAAPAKPAERRMRGEGAPEKSTLVPNTAYATRPNAVAPSVAQAQPGATTNLVTRRPSPPAHQQPGLPKINAGATFVDSKTLLPKRGAQGAGTRAAPGASAPAALPRP